MMCVYICWAPISIRMYGFACLNLSFILFGLCLLLHYSYHPKIVKLTYFYHVWSFNIKCKNITELSITTGKIFKQKNWRADTKTERIKRLLVIKQTKRAFMLCEYQTMEVELKFLSYSKVYWQFKKSSTVTKHQHRHMQTLHEKLSVFFSHFLEFSYSRCCFFFNSSLIFFTLTLFHF